MRKMKMKRKFVVPDSLSCNFLTFLVSADKNKGVINYVLIDL